MEEILNEKIVKELLGKEGKARGENIKLDGDFILKEKGPEGLDKVEKELVRLGCPLKYREVNTSEFYPVGLEAISMLAIKKVFNLGDDKIREMGARAAKFSFLMRLFMRYFLSLGVFMKEAPRLWHEHYTIGTIVVKEIDEKKKRAVVWLEDFNVHPIFCVNFQGYFSRLLEIIINGQAVSQETKCLFRGDEHHEYLFTWQEKSSGSQATESQAKKEFVMGRIRTLLGLKNVGQGKKEEKQPALLLNELAALEEYIRDLFNFSPAPICFISPVGIILEVNPALEKLSGFKADEVVGEPAERLFKREEIAFLARDTFREEFVEGRELQLLGKENKEVIVQASTRVRKDEKGEAVGYFLSLFDLTDIKKTEAELKRVQKALLNILEDTEEARRKAEEERNKTQAIITNFADGLFFFDASHRLVLMNPQAEVFFKIKKESAIGKSPREMKNIPELSPLIDFLAGSLKEVSRQELVLREGFILEISVINMGSKELDQGDLIVLHDVSREKAVERLKTEFVSLAAHQLRTPLSAIKWSIKMLLDGDLGKINEGQKDVLEKTYQSNERMIVLIDDLLNLARIEEGKYLLTPTRVNMVKICQQATDILSEAFKRKEVKLSFPRPTGKVPDIFGDEEKLKLVVQNLLDNALKYTPRRGKVSLFLKQTREGLRGEVRDSGIGIAENEQERVFSKFFRTKEAALMEPVGTGLGLYMARNIVESHNGKIWFETKPGQGTTFFFFLPKSLGRV